MRMTIERKIQIGFGVSLLFLLLIGGAAFWSESISHTTVRSVNHTYQVLNRLEATLTTLLNIETSTRAFVVAEDEMFLQPYRQGTNDIKACLEELRGLVADNRDQQQRLLDLQPLITQRVVRASQLIELRRTQGITAAAAMLAQGDGQRLMDQIRGGVGRMAAEERLLLAERQAREKTANGWCRVMDLGFCTLSLLLVGLAGVMVRRDFQKRAEAEAERDRFFSLSLDMLCISNADGYFKRVSPAFTVTLGWSVEEMLAGPFIDFVHPDDRAATLAAVERQTAKREKVLQFENRYRCKGGSWRWLSWKSVPQPGGFMYATARDVTEFKESQAALEQSREETLRERERLKFIFDSVPVGILFTLTEADGTRTQLINDAHMRISGLTRERAFEPDIFKIITVAEDQVLQADFTRQIETGEIDRYTMDKRYCRPDGKLVWVYLSFQRQRYPDGSHEDLHVVVDITARKQAEAALRQSETRYRTLFNSIDEGFCVVEMIFDHQKRPVDYRFLEVNPSFEEQTGLHNVMGKRMRELAPNHEESWFEVYGAIALTGEAVRFQDYAEQLGRWFDVYAFRAGEPKDRQVAILFRDITTRKRMEENLRQSEESLAVTLHSIGDAVLCTDVAGRVVRMNPVAEKMTGWNQAEALGQPVGEVFKIINELTRQPAEIPVMKVLTTGAIQGLANHTVIISRDGVEKPIADSAAPIRGKDGRTLGVVLVFRDVTEEKQAERAVLESEERLRAMNELLEQRVKERTAVLHQQSEIISSANGAMIICGHADDVIKFWNQGAARLYGWPKKDVIGKNIHALLQATFPRPLEEIKAAFLKEGYWQGELRHTCHDGRQIVVMSSWTLQRDETGQPLSRLAINTDITERKRVEAALNESERFARATLDALTAHVAILDAQGVIIAVNKTWQKFAEQNGLASAQAGPGMNYLEVCASTTGLATDASIKMARGIRAVIAGEKKEFTLEYDCHSPTEKRWFHCRVTRFPGDGPVCVVVAHEDVTQMKLLEHQQIRSNRMESLGTLAGGVAHDLNNALAPILMGVELLRERYPAETDIVNMFQASALRGAGMVRQLLTFAKGADGARVAIQLTRLIEEMRGIIHNTFPKNIHVEVRGDKKLPPILGDVTQLHQVLLNLCVNARDAMPHGGLLSLVAESAEIDSVYASSVPDAKPGNYVVLRVHDTGTGISPDHLERIFDPFFTTKDPDKGTGLGLSNVMGIVKGHGGFVQVYSQLGHGSTFAIYLPANAATGDTELLSRAGEIFHGKGQTILLVEDEPAVREIGCTVLTRLNFNPLSATDGADGLMKAVEHRLTLAAVITDVHMPHMDGLAFVHALRRILPDIPVVVTSGRLEEATKEEFKALGVTLQLDKPFTEVQLANLLKTVFAS